MATKSILYKSDSGDVFHARVEDTILAAFDVANVLGDLFEAAQSEPIKALFDDKAALEAANGGALTDLPSSISPRQCTVSILGREFSFVMPAPLAALANTDIEDLIEADYTVGLSVARVQGESSANFT
ncbi:MAG: hypothetical protein K2X27_13500 [Candidatus Obscuribacterales bacterium]|nr:hypothetical protein [Candidatus Obscuribacterales bacterium]